MSLPPCQLAGDTNLQYEVLREAEKEGFYDLEDRIEKASQDLLKHWRNRQQHAVPFQLFAADGNSWLPGSGSITTRYFQYRVDLPLGLREHEARYLIGRIVREIYENAWEAARE